MGISFQIKYATGDVFVVVAQMGFRDDTFCRVTKTRNGKGNMAIDIGEEISRSVLTCNLGTYNPLCDVEQKISGHN